MVTKKNLAIAISVIYCLTATLFMIIPSLSLSSVHSYDPLLDVNDDGKIDSIDISKVAAAFRTSRTPINKTALLLGANAVLFNSTDVDRLKCTEKIRRPINQNKPGTVIINIVNDPTTPNDHALTHVSSSDSPRMLPNPRCL